MSKSQLGNPPLGARHEQLTYRRPISLSLEDFSFQAPTAEPIDSTQLISAACSPKAFDKDQKPTFRQQLAFYFDTSRLGRIWDLLDTVLNFLLVVDTKVQPLPPKLFLLEWSLAFLLLLQSLPRVYIAPDMFDYLVSPFNLVNWASTVPPIIVPIIDHISSDIDLSHTYMAAGFMVYVYPFRFMRLHMSFCKILLPVRNSLFDFSMLAKKTLYLCSTILFTIIFVSAWIHIVTYKFYETNGAKKPITFFDAFFFTTISSTSGFNSNLVPDSTFNRFVILFIMVSGALFLPEKIGELLALISKRSTFDNSFELEKNQQHVIVCGSFSNRSLCEFLREFFCEDHGLQTMNTKVVVLNSVEPSDDLVSMLNDPVYSSRVQYVKGLPTSYKSLRKVRAGKAKACFVLTDKYTSDDDREADATAVMLALAIKRFNKGLRLFAQVNLPENKPHFDCLAHQLVCIQELRLGMLAQNLLNPGFSTLIYLLATSITSTTCKELSLGIQRNSKLEWVEEYVHGATHEIYSVTMPPCFVGLTFIAVAETVYRHFGATLFAMNLADTPHTSRRGEVGFIISCSAYDAGLISRLGEDGSGLKEFTYIFEEAPSYQNEDPPSLDPPLPSPSIPSFSANGLGAFDPVEIPKRPLVLQLDGNSSDENREPEAVPYDANVITLPEKEPLPVEPGLSLQERNISKVISEMVKENSYFSAVSELNDISGHVVICDGSPSFPRAMEYFVGSFRAPHLSNKPPIVILTVAEPSRGQRNVLEQLGDVHFLRGSPLSRKALFSAGVSRAAKAVVLCHDAASTRGGERTVDANSLLTVLNMGSMALDPNFFVVVEFIYRENMKLVGAGEVISSSEKYAQALLRPAFMSGHVLAPCMLEPLVCQAYYNEDFLVVVDRLVFDASLDLSRRVGGYAPTFRPTFQGSSLPLSRTRPYVDLFTWLLHEKSAVPLGVYRTRSFKGRQLSYVITNPKPEMSLLDLDKVYVVAHRCP
ncbi:hypothetical protein L0F63_002877 [Massospora cicadina]|nr:hypothetical protein L0F63_002877 [Massospora cicadina]